MTTEEIIIHIFCRVDDGMGEVEKVPQADLYPSEVVTIGILFALKGGRFRAFCRWLKRDYDPLFGGDTMAFPQWLQFIFLPNVRSIIVGKGKFPTVSQVGMYAVREFDTYAEDTIRLQTLLSEFDQLF